MTDLSAFQHTTPLIQTTGGSGTAGMLMTFAWVLLGQKPKPKKSSSN